MSGPVLGDDVAGEITRVVRLNLEIYLADLCPEADEVNLAVDGWTDPRGRVDNPALQRGELAHRPRIVHQPLFHMVTFAAEGLLIEEPNQSVVAFCSI
jgi:hypothetical protein